MGMKPYSYVVAGIKTTTQQCKANGVDLYEQFEENEHDIRAIYGEGTDDVLIGEVLFESDPYEDTDHAVELKLSNYIALSQVLTQSGVKCTRDDIRLYAITVWL